MFQSKQLKASKIGTLMALSKTSCSSQNSLFLFFYFNFISRDMKRVAHLLVKFSFIRDDNFEWSEDFSEWIVNLLSFCIFLLVFQ